MKVRYKETDLEAEVTIRLGEHDLELVGNANVFYPGEPDTGEEWTITPDACDDFELVEATAAERDRLLRAGFRF